jgi:hypothetical protein
MAIYILRTSKPVKVGEWVAINGSHNKYGIVSAVTSDGYARIHSGSLPKEENPRSLTKALFD